MPWSMKVTGSTRVANRMRRAAAASKNTGPITYKWAQRVRSTLKGTPYPSYLAKFKHKRTGGLANGWAVVSAGRNAFSIVNNANRRSFPYPIIVVGNAKGERKGRANHPSFARWWLARPIIDKNVPDLRDDIAESIVDA